MLKLTPYHLTFKSGLHLGTRGVNLEESGVSIPSDTIYSALLDAWTRSGREADIFVNDVFRTNPPFLLSSSFPFVGQVRFYPMPVNPHILFGRETLEERGKDVKRIAYLSEALLKKALSGEKLDQWLFPSSEESEPKTGVALQGNSLWLTVEETTQLPRSFREKNNRLGSHKARPLHALRYQRVWATEQIPRVTITRVTSASQIFHVGKVTFAPGCGLWFGVHWRNPNALIPAPTELTYKQMFEHLMMMLAEDGLGGERSTGHGAFTYITEKEVVLDEPQGNQPAYLLSRYYPAKKELPLALTQPEAAYRLFAVAGWLRSWSGTTQRRKRIFLVTEGSLICPPSYPAGDICEVSPDYENPQGKLPHKVYRLGLALAVRAASDIAQETPHV